MTPGVVGDEFQLHILGSQASLLVERERLGVGGERCQMVGVGTVVGGEVEVLVGQHLKSRLLVDEYAHDVEVVVDSLGAIHQRSALYGNHAAIGFNALQSSDGARLHIEVQAHHIALLPLAVDGQVAILGGGDGHLCAIDRAGGVQTLIVAVAIEVAGNDIAFQPAGNANLHSELSCRVLIDGDGDIAVPRILCLLRKAHLLTFHVERSAVGKEEVHVDRAVFHSIDVAGQRGNEAADVARAAGTAEPCLALVLAHRLQWVGVEEAAAIE